MHAEIGGVLGDGSAGTVGSLTVCYGSKIVSELTKDHLYDASGIGLWADWTAVFNVQFGCEVEVVAIVEEGVGACGSAGVGLSIDPNTKGMVEKEVC